MVYVPKTSREFLSRIPSHIKVSEFPLTKFDASKLEGFQKEYSVFKGISMRDIAFITKNLDTINFFRGCNTACLHCPKKAIAPKFGRESILYEDFKHFIMALSCMSERLGFNILNGSKNINISDDSDFFGKRVKGQRRDYSVAELIQFLYEHLRVPVSFFTTGWKPRTGRSSGYREIHDASRRLNYLVKNNPDAINEVKVQVNPFIKEEGYVLRMADTIRVLLDLFKMQKAKIVYKHSATNDAEYGEQAAKRLYEKIYAELERGGVNLEYIPELNPDFVTKSSKNNWILPIGRGRAFMPKSQEDYFETEYSKEKERWENLSVEDKRAELLENSRKCLDIDGSIYTKKPTNIFYGASQIEVNVPTDIKLNFIDKSKPNPIYRELEL